MKFRSFLLTATAVTCLAVVGAAQAFANEAPPAGNVIYELTGQTILDSYQTAMVSFTAAQASTHLSFAFREDPAAIKLANVSLTLNGTGPNLLTNGDFSAGPVGSAAPAGWTYLNTFGAPYGGIVTSGCGPGGSGNCYFDAAMQAYDAISQDVATTIGASYTLSFQYADSCAGDCGTAGGVTTYQPLSTNGDVSGIGGNGRDMFVYAGAVPAAVPEPGSVALIATALAGLGFFGRRRRA